MADFDPECRSRGETTQHVNQILRGFDDEIRCHLQETLIHRGIQLLTNTQVEQVRLKPIGSGLQVSLNTQLLEETTASTTQFDQVVFTTGRKPSLDGLGFDLAGVEIEKGVVQVDG